MKVRPIDRALDLNAGIGSGNSADNGGDARQVGREQRELLYASVQASDLLNAPRGSPGGADRHDEVDAVPEVVDVGAAELRVGGEGRQGVHPLFAEGAEVCLPGDSVGEGLAGGSGDGGGAAGAGKGQTPLRRVEVCAVGERAGSGG